jgi:hypothetical protein
MSQNIYDGLKPLNEEVPINFDKFVKAETSSCSSTKSSKEEKEDEE